MKRSITAVSASLAGALTPTLALLALGVSHTGSVALRMFQTFWLLPDWREMGPARLAMPGSLHDTPLPGKEVTRAATTCVRPPPREGPVTTMREAPDG